MAQQSRKTRSRREDAPTGGGVVLSAKDCRRRRLALGLSTYQLSRRAGLVELTVLNFEAGAVRPRPVTIAALTKALRRLETERAGGAPDVSLPSRAAGR